jgi:hypothetical protein
VTYKVHSSLSPKAAYLDQAQVQWYFCIEGSYLSDAVSIIVEPWAKSGLQSRLPITSLRDDKAIKCESGFGAYANIPIYRAVSWELINRYLITTLWKMRLQESVTGIRAMGPVTATEIAKFDPALFR